jgi:hypothetical protein
MDQEGRIGAVLRQFGCPQEPWDETIPAAILETACKRIVGQFLERHKEALTANGTGLEEVFATFLRSDADLPSSWQSWIGLMERATQFGSEEPLVVAASFALCCASSGTWKASLERPTRLRWGRWSLPLASHIQVRDSSASTRTVTLKDPDGVSSTVELHVIQGQCTGCELLPAAGAQSGVVLLCGSQAPKELWRGSEALSSICVSRIGPVMVRSITNAFALLGDYAPLYRRWVDRVVTDIIVSRYKYGSSQSGSWREAPGTIQLSWSPEPISVAEALVHEASHQYAYQVYRVSPLDDGSDTTLYYSSAARRPRPLERILFAYHAFANILLFYEEILKAGAPKAATIKEHIGQSRRAVLQLDAPLVNSTALTPAGRALYEALRSRVQPNS